MSFVPDTNVSDTKIGRLLCKMRLHSWGFLWARDAELKNVGWVYDWYGTISESCRRPACRLRRTRKDVKLPKKVRL